MKNKIYITSPIYYVNDVPHIGHVYTSLACDIIARFHRQNGKEVHFLTGTDEHGKKVEKSAEKIGITTQEFCDNISQKFRDISDFFNISYDDFIRTTENRHKKTVEEFWHKLEENGWIYQDIYEGWYSVRDEAFYQESEIENGIAPSGAEVSWEKQESYFFKLSKFQDILLQLYQKYPKIIAPKSRRNEVVSFLKGGKDYQKGSLKDLSISRHGLNWGIKVPDDQSHSIYVWLDALANYISALGGFSGEKFSQFWQAEDSDIFHIIGKDIIRFHTIYWPAFLLAFNYKYSDLSQTSSELDQVIKFLPNKIFAHGWWTNEGQKISKSLGNIIDPYQEISWIENFGVSKEIAIDYFRFFLIKEVPFGQDGNYSRENLLNCVNSDLANNIGNLLQRTVKFAHKNFQGSINKTANFDIINQEILQEWKNIDKIELYIENLDINQCNFSEIIFDIIQLSSIINKFFDNNAPWEKFKQGKIEKTKEILYITCNFLRIIAILILPFIPNCAKRILDILNIEVSKRNFNHIGNNHFSQSYQLDEAQVIFQKLYQPS